MFTGSDALFVFVAAIASKAACTGTSAGLLDVLRSFAEDLKTLRNECTVAVIVKDKD